MASHQTKTTMVRGCFTAMTGLFRRPRVAGDSTDGTRRGPAAPLPRRSALAGLVQLYHHFSAMTAK